MPLGVVLPDTTPVISLVTILLLFVSPISFKMSMVPDYLQIMLLLNPVTYMAEVFRACLINGYPINMYFIGIYTAMCGITFTIGAVFFQRFKDFIVDYE